MSNQEDGSGGFRNSDPDTSRDAAERLDATKKEAMVVIAHIKAGHDGLNWNEVVAATGLRRDSVSPRFKPLIKKGLLRIKTDEYGQPIRRDHQMVRVATGLAKQVLESFGTVPVVPQTTNQVLESFGTVPVVPQTTSHRGN